jgi:hypothetical protein
MARNFNEFNGNPFAINPKFCAIAAVNRREVETWNTDRLAYAEASKWP